MSKDYILESEVVALSVVVRRLVSAKAAIEREKAHGLSDYKRGLSVAKEYLQNAIDDIMAIGEP